MKPDTKNITALLQLLDDPDEQVFNQIKNEILDYGNQVISDLEKHWEDSEDVLKVERIEELIFTIKSSDIKKRFQKWISGGGVDLLEGALIVTRFQYHNLDEQKIRIDLAQIKQDIWIEINESQTAFEKAKVFNHIFYNAYGFKGNSDDFYAISNSFINRVMETKKGTSLSLGILYIHLAQSLDIPVYGVNLPHHFVLVYKDENRIMETLTGEEEEALFYLNPFTFGSAFGKQELKEFISQLDVPDDPKFYKACDNLSIIKRMIKNIIFSYTKSNKSQKAKYFQDLLNLF